MEFPKRKDAIGDVYALTTVPSIYVCIVDGKWVIVVEVSPASRLRTASRAWGWIGVCTRALEPTRVLLT